MYLNRLITDPLVRAQQEQKFTSLSMSTDEPDLMNTILLAWLQVLQSDAEDVHQGRILDGCTNKLRAANKAAMQASREQQNMETNLSEAAAKVNAKWYLHYS